MKLKDVKVGMKVVPHSKTEGYCNLDKCELYRRAKERGQPFLYVTGIDDMSDVGTVVILSDTNEKLGEGNYYKAEDFEPYVESSFDIIKRKEKEIKEIEASLQKKKAELDDFRKEVHCGHSIIKVYSYFDLRFQCVDCGKIINRFDNHRTFTIVPNEEMEDPPPKTGLVEYSEVEKDHDGF